MFYTVFPVHQKILYIPLFINGLFGMMDLSLCFAGSLKPLEKTAGNELSI